MHWEGVSKDEILFIIQSVCKRKRKHFGVFMSLKKAHESKVNWRYYSIYCYGWHGERAFMGSKIF